MKKFIPYILVAAIAAVLTIAYFPLRNHYLFLKEPVNPLTDAIPEETVLIVKTGSTEKLIKVIRTSGLLDMLQRNKIQYGFDRIARTVDEISRKNEFFRKLAGEGEVMACLVPDNEMKPEVLYLIGVGKITPGSLIDKLSGVFPKNTTFDQVKSGQAELYRMSSGTSELWFYVRNGILAISGKRSVAEQSGKMADKKISLSDDPVFAKIAGSSGKRVDGVLLLNNLRLVKLFLQSDKFNPLVFNASPFDGWTSLDLHIGKDKVLMDGFLAGKSDSTILSRQSPGKSGHLMLFPAETAFSLTLTLSDQEGYLSRLNGKDTLHLPGYDSANQATSTEIFRRAEHLGSWIGNSVSLVALPEYFSGNDSARMVLISLKDPDSARQHLKPFLKPVDQEIRSFTASGLVSRLWGGLFSTGPVQYCLFTDQVLVLSPDRALLSDYAADLSEGRLSGSTALFSETGKLLAEESNVTILMDPSICGRFARNYNPEIIPSVAKQWFGVPSSAGLLCLQLSAADPLLYAHAFALLGTGVNRLAKQVVKSDFVYPRVLPWHSSGDVNSGTGTDRQGINQAGEINVSRILIPVRPGGKKEFNGPVFAVNKNTIHCLEQDGGIRWSFRCKGEPTGDIFTIHLKGSVHYLITTSSQLHIIGSDGKESRNSPVSPPAGVNGKLSVFDYDRDGHFRILYPGKDGKVQNITLEGKSAADWQKPSISGKLNSIQFFRTGGRDFILISEKKGRVSVVDRRGKTRIRISDEVSVSSGSEIFENRTNSKGIFLMASSGGNLAYIDANGQLSESRFGDHGSNPWFEYTDFDNDGNNDFVFCGKGRITVYSRMKKVIAEVTMKNAGFSKPVIFSSAKGSWLAVRELGTGKIVAFNRQGKQFNRTNLMSECDPVIVKGSGSQYPQLVTVIRGKLVYTPLK